MKTVITSNGNSLDSKIDIHFGRCSYFVFFDNITQSIEFYPNPYKDNNEGAGTLAAKFIVSRKVDKIVSGELGLKVKPLLDSYKIQVIILKNSDKSIQDIVNMLNH